MLFVMLGDLNSEKCMLSSLRIYTCYWRKLYYQ